MREIYNANAKHIRHVDRLLHAHFPTQSTYEFGLPEKYSENVLLFNQKYVLIIIIETITSYILLQTLTLTKTDARGVVSELGNLTPEMWNFRMESPYARSRNSPAWISFLNLVILL